jgi:hypothetical protein
MMGGQPTQGNPGADKNLEGGSKGQKQGPNTNLGSEELAKKTPNPQHQQQQKNQESSNIQDRNIGQQQ